MTPSDYIKESARTDGETQLENAEKALMYEAGFVDDLHSVIGVVTEAGELADALKKKLFYAKPYDLANVKEEVGDLLWYVAKIIRDHGWSFEEIMALNIAKLKARYPNKFSNEAAVHRDLVAKRDILTKGGAMPVTVNQTKGQG